MSADPDVPTTLGRRAFLGTVGVGLSALAWGGAAFDLFSKGTTVLPQAVRNAVPLGEGWRIYSVNPPFPDIPRKEWTLTVEGLVEQRMDLTWAQFLALDQREQVNDFHCVTGWTVRDVRWTGVPLRTLLAAAGPMPNAKGIEFVSAEEPYVDTLTMQQVAEMDDIVLAHRMDGELLSRDHGAPVRLVIPKMYGYKSVKWLSRIRVVDEVQDGYWEQRGYDRDAYVGRSNGL